MPTYQYQARTQQQQIIKGVSVANSPGDLAKVLRERNLQPINIKATKTKQAQVGSRIKVKDVAIFARLLSTLLDSGVPLIQALAILTQQVENPRLARVVGEIRQKIETGETLSDAIGDHEKIFSRLFINMVRAGETGGGLDKILSTMADHLEKQVALQGKIKSSMTYPVTVLVIAFGITYFMLTTIVPKFSEILTQMDAPMPALTKFLILLSHGASTMLIPLIILTPLAIFGYRKYYATKAGRYMIDGIKLKLPLLGNVLKKGGIATFSATLGLLLHSGVNIIAALEITRATAGNIHIEDAINNARLSVETGQMIHTALAATPIFPPMVTSMVGIGEESGSLDAMLDKIASFYEREVEDAIDSMTAALEPALMVFLGVVVGGIVIGLFMPLFSVLGTLSNG